MQKIVPLSVAVAAGTLLMAEPVKSPQVRFEDPQQVQIMWQTHHAWPLGGISICKSGAPETAREVWMKHDDELHYYRGFDHWVFLTGLEDGATYDYYLLGKDQDGKVQRIVESPYSFRYPDYSTAVSITGGPFLTNPGTDCMSVVWRTDIEAGAAVDVRKAGAKESVRFLGEADGVLARHNTQHVVHLKGLDEGTAYEYRPVIFDARDEKFIPTGEWRNFTTLSSQKKTFRTLFISDTHGDRLKLAKMLKDYHAGQCDFILYGGDLVWSAMHAPDCANLWDEFLNTSVDAFAGTVPLVMSRGNHEGGGLYSDSYTEVFRTAEGNTYQAFRTGDYFFVILDSGDIHRPEQDAFPQLFARQREWLKGVLDSNACKTAKFRIMTVHASSHGAPDGQINERMRTYFNDLLNTANPERRFQLCLAGHEHLYLRYNAGESVNRGEAFPADKKIVDGKDYQYTVMLNGGPMGGQWEYTVMEVLGTPEKVQVNLFDGITNQLIDAVSIDEKGKVTELGLHKN